MSNRIEYTNRVKLIDEVFLRTSIELSALDPQLDSQSSVQSSAQSDTQSSNPFEDPEEDGPFRFRLTFETPQGDFSLGSFDLSETGDFISRLFMAAKEAGEKLNQVHQEMKLLDRP